MKNKVLVIGLDGATWKVLEPLMKRGTLPFLTKLVKEGASGILKSSNPPMTPVAWSSFQTGVTPERNGIIHYHLFSPQDKKSHVISASDIEIPTIHDLLSLHKKKIITVNLPVTYPVKKTNGIIVSGILTPDSDSQYTYPASIKEEIESLFGPFPYVLGSESFKKHKSVPRLVKSLTSVMEKRCDIAQYLMEKKDWDLFLYHFKTLDALQHPLYTHMEPGLATFDKQHYEEILPYFEKMDFLIKRFVQASSANRVILMSDHGFREQKCSYALNLWLEQEGYLRLKDSVPKKVMRTITKKAGEVLKTVGLKKATTAYAPKKVASKAHISVDWNTTQAFMGSGVYVGYIYVFDKECMGELKEKLLALTDEEGSRVIEHVYTKEEFFSPSYDGDHAPDLIAIPAKGYVLSPRLEGKLCIFPQFGRDYNVGIHDPDGIVILHGKGITHSKNITADIVDVLPTIHNFLDLPEYPHFEGSPILKDL